MRRSQLYIILLLGCAAGYSLLLFIHLQGAIYGAPELNLCVFKGVTGIACPSCGATRSVLALADGDLMEAVAINPLGLLVALVLLIAPPWILYDLVRKQESVLVVYVAAEQIIRKKYVAIPAAALVLANWIWNIWKGL